MTSIGQIGNCHAFEFPRSAAGRFLTAMHSIAEHFGYHFLAAQKMDLETMCLFRGTGFCIDALDVRFRIRIGSFSHELWLMTQTLR